MPNINISKYRKILFAICLAVFATFCNIECKAQDTPNQMEEWEEFESDRGNFVFQMPKKPQKFDTAHILYYACEMNSSFVFQIHLIDDVKFTKSNYKGVNYIDPLELYIKQYLYVTKGELLSIRDVKTSSKRGINSKEASIAYYEEGSEMQKIDFFRVYIWDDKLLATTITGNKKEVEQLLEFKTIFLNSIEFHEN